jgi:ABC-type transport system substrate-binding protein
MSAAFLAACGGGDDNGGSKDAASLLFKPADTSRQAAKGGVMQNFMTAGVEHFDQVTGNFIVQAHTDHAYSRLVRFKIGTVDKPPEGESEPDVATSWEMSPDGLQYTFKIRQGMKFDPRPPTNGRVLTTDDIKFSWERFAKDSTSRSQLVNAVTKDAPVTSVTFPDSSTAVFKLAFPFGAFLHSIGYSWHFAVMPVEADGKFEVKQEMRGSGPWMMTKYEPSLSWEYQRNPNWWGAADRPYLDGIKNAYIPESATQQAQFKAGNLWALGQPYNNAPSADLVLAIKREVPSARLRAITPFTGNGSYNLLGFSKRDGNPWFTDVRMRQAVSMLLDREAWIDTFYNVKGFEREGVPMETGWNSHVPCSWPTIWLDPKGNKLGEGAKNFQYNPDEAARLLRAAGKYGSEQPYTHHSPGTGGFGGDLLIRQNEVIALMLQQGGHFKLKIQALHYVNEYRPQFLWNKGDFDGISGNHPLGGWPDWDLALWSGYTPGSRNDWVRVELPNGVHDLMVQHRRESDPNKKKALMEQWQKQLAKDMWVVPHPGFASSFALYHPWLGNGGYFQTWTGGGTVAEGLIHAWYDKAKDPKAS